MKKVLFALIGPISIASCRIRVYQYIEQLQRDLLFEPVIYYCGSAHSYKLGRFGSWIIGVWLKRWRMLKLLINVWYSRQYQLVFLHRVLLPQCVIQRLYKLGRPVIFDFDDALILEGFHQKSVAEKRFQIVVKASSHVITSTEYNAKNIESLNSHVSIVISAINVEHQPVKTDYQHAPPVVIGWIGSPSTSVYLELIKNVFQQLARVHAVQMIIIGGDKNFRIADVAIEHRTWNLKREATDLLTFDIGIMPLPDNEWTRAKGGFKLIQYMAAGLPIVASAVGMNKELVLDNINGYLVNTPEQWCEKLSFLVLHPEVRERFGKAGRALAEEKYSSTVAYKKLHNIFNSVLGL